VTGVRAAEAEVLAPIAARIRRALGHPRGARLRGTSPFEDAVADLLDETRAPPRARRAVVALGARCPAARRLHAMPDARTIAGRPSRALARALGSLEVARRLQALARGVARSAPSSPMRP
jgi:hypothetical protein